MPSGYGFGRVPRPLRLVTGSLGLAGMEGLASAVSGFGAGIYLLNQAMNNLAKAMEKQVQQQLQKAQTPQELANAFQTELARQSQMAGYGGGVTSLPLIGKTGADMNRDRGGALGWLFNALGAKEPSWLQGGPPAPSTKTQGNINKAAAQQFVADSPFEAYAYAMTGGPGSAEILAELGRRKQTGMVQAQWAAQFAGSMYGPAATNVTVNAPTGDRNSIGLAVKAAQDARDRNNGRYVTQTGTRRG